MLKTCAGCGTRYAWSLSQCPHDGDVNYLESGEVVDVLENESTATTGTLVVGHSAQVDASAAPCSRTLPLAASAGVGKRLVVRKVDSSANAVTIDADGSDTIDGETSYSLANPGEGVELVSNGTAEWLTVQILTIDPILDEIFLSKTSRWYGTAAELAARGIPGPGVPVYETDTKIARVGDGVTSVASLPLVGSATYAGIVGPVSGITRDGAGRVTGFVDQGVTYSEITYSPAGYVSTYKLNGVLKTVTRDGSNRVTGIA